MVKSGNVRKWKKSVLLADLFAKCIPTSVSSRRPSDGKEIVQKGGKKEEEIIYYLVSGVRIR
jgi:hypothetical protein